VSSGDVGFGAEETPVEELVQFLERRSMMAIAQDFPHPRRLPASRTLLPSMTIEAVHR
jgi:hypothetical protein